MWRRLWAVPTMLKVCHFMWKVVKNWVANKANLFKRMCDPSPLCPICISAPESIEHTLFHCPWTRAVWFGCRKSFWTTDLDTSLAAIWMEDLLCGHRAKETTLENMTAIFQVCWAIWKARNAYVFTGNPLNPGDTIECAAGIEGPKVGNAMASSAISIEAWALRIACGTAMDLNLCEAVFESDCLELINCFKESNSPTPWEIQAVRRY
ncbi:hypothetical protein RHMOL_Rhmol08G0141800 [Rhododendron molle]|uniref:Uncharacterized protein n=1 Tax=Rhododendron molle TaxID=49168 RepID=A0ACC0MNL6_RHOML|nr:hypothetical protein RHMOL_Rhmol08G0141800 [Rhododendron molle]